MLVHCWPAVYDVGPTLNQHCCNVSCLLGIYQPNSYSIHTYFYSENTRRSPNLVLLLAHRLWRWPYIKTTLRLCLVLGSPLTYRPVSQLGIQIATQYQSLSTWSITGPGTLVETKSTNSKSMHPFSAGTAFIRQNLMYVDFRFWRIKTVPALKELKYL